ncbi:MAG: DUF1987 domain-containing protein [Bacteroidia bacterium]|jgi:hypothetical protein|nr:DUF1987 domain-containing protein [Bacteroidia bacterium]
MIPPLHIPETRSTPEIHFDADNDIYLIRGRSIPPDASSFFYPLDKWVEALAATGSARPVNIRIRLEHLNTGTIRSLLTIFSKLLRVREKGTQVNFEWYYNEEDEDLVDKGEEMSLILDVPFRYISFAEGDY